ncbi:hypothetical protein NDU88_004390 [Pleurodeles waltl]|uniref:Uncharacterized protein n=1 Tax=Pleurodeles waltl TaxID=8319 RepID=A0AAV7UF60_PLEWA|nr:hypothetical protein NDU88_004390 [Pleurodeles waltl]
MEEGREEGAKLPANTAMEKVGAEARGVGKVAVDKGKTIKDQCPVPGVNLESQDEQSGETPFVTVKNIIVHQILEETAESLKEDEVLIKQDLRQVRVSEQELQDKLERLENAARRNNL